MKQKTFTIKIHTHFCAAHVIPGYPGPCSRLHGHNWKMEVAVTGQKLNDIGICIDFRDIKEAAKKLVDTVDHRYMNEIPPFDKINPTAENIAWWAYQNLSEAINSEKARVQAITIWETDTCAVTYTEEDDHD